MSFPVYPVNKNDEKGFSMPLPRVEYMLGKHDPQGTPLAKQASSVTVHRVGGETDCRTHWYGAFDKGARIRKSTHGMKPLRRRR